MDSELDTNPAPVADADGREVMISVIPPATHRGYVQAADYILQTRIEFNGRSYALSEFLAACMPYLEEISGSADNIRALRAIEGYEFATVTIPDPTPASEEA